MVASVVPIEVGSFNVIEVSAVQLQQLAGTQIRASEQEPLAGSDTGTAEASPEVLRQLMQNTSANPTALALFVIDGGIRRPLEDLDRMPARQAD